MSTTAYFVFVTLLILANIGLLWPCWDAFKLRYIGFTGILMATLSVIFTVSVIVIGVKP